jgi:hypothetical protein
VALNQRDRLRSQSLAETLQLRDQMGDVAGAVGDPTPNQIH